jgi:hypothetical protein
MKTKHLRTELMRVFSYSTWPELRENLREATAPFPIKVDWRCMAVGRQKEGEHCAFGERIGRMAEIDRCFVTEHLTYVRFNASETIFRYTNSAEMIHQLKYFDLTGMFDDMEDGDEFILEPPGKARSHQYAKERREAIKSGEHTVKPRGPNPNMRREPVHHFRPY